MTATLPPIVRSVLDVARPQSVRAWAREVAGLINRPIAEPHVTAATEVADVRRITLQLRDRQERAIARRMPVLVWIATAAGGAPSAAGNTVAVVDGFVLATPLAHGAYWLLTDGDGKVVFDVEITGAATRHVLAATAGEPRDSGPLNWA